jgi:hypothetical protein
MDETDVGCSPEDGADRVRHVGGVETHRRHLVEQRLEGMEVVAIDQLHIDRCSGEPASRRQPGKTATHDHHPVHLFFPRISSCY